MLGMLLAYDAAGNVVATLDYLVRRDASGRAVGLVDFAKHERDGQKLRALWNVAGAQGSAVWPEWIGQQAHDFRVELDGLGRATALVHKVSGVRRERADIEAAIQARREAAGQRPADLRDLVGGPNRPLRLDEDGRVRER